MLEFYRDNGTWKLLLYTKVYVGCSSTEYRVTPLPLVPYVVPQQDACHDVDTASIYNGDVKGPYSGYDSTCDAGGLNPKP